MESRTEFYKLVTATGLGVVAGAALAVAALKRPTVQQCIPRQVLERLGRDNPEHRKWMGQMQAFIFDIDGVIHVTGTPVPGVAQTMTALRSAGKEILFFTNNPATTQQTVVDLFAGFGIKASPEEVMTSAIAAGSFLKSRGLGGKLVYVIGTNALAGELERVAGVQTFGAESDASKTRADVLKEFKELEMDPLPGQVAAVVVGIDFDINYYKLARAANYLRKNSECLFVGTNPDPRAPLGKTSISPAGGSLVQAVSCISGRSPDIICGKPNGDLAKHLLASRSWEPQRTCMVGDRTDTDIEFGTSGGMSTLWVESGCMTLKEVIADREFRQPRFIAPSVATLGELLEGRSN